MTFKNWAKAQDKLKDEATALNKKSKNLNIMVMVVSRIIKSKIK